jgi:hypothetical protein
MKQNSVRSFHVGLRLLLVALALLALGSVGRAQDSLEVADSADIESPPPAESSRDWFSGLLGITANYNDNILDYSPRDLNQLENNPDSVKFAIRRPSDEFTNVKARLSARPYLFRRNPTLIQLRCSGNLFAASGIRNYFTLGLEIKQSFLRKNFITTSISILPRYYLRNISYRDLTLTPRDWLKTTEARFQKRSYGLEVGRNVTPRSAVSVGYEYTQTDYNDLLDERDNNTHKVNVDASVRLSPLLKLSGSYSYAISWAKGRELSDSLTDISYWANRISLETLISLKKDYGIPVSLSTTIVFEYQAYLSGKIYEFPPRTFAERYGDKYHYGRFDRYYRISADLSYQVLQNVDLTLQYFWEHNVANLEETLDAGTYQTHQVGLGVEYAF